MPENLINKEVKLKMGLFIVLIAALIISTGVIGFLISKNDSEIIISKSSSEETTNVVAVVTPQATAIVEENTEKIQVYVVGEVNKPGVVTIEKGQIIDDAIKAAGGPTDKADLENINLAYILNENVMLKVLPKKEKTSDAVEIGKEPNASVPAPNERMSGIEIRSDSGGAVFSENEQKSESKGKININKATEAELETLPGVGPSTASKIVAFRKQNGNFKKIEDIMNVPGIGESKFSSMKDLISVD